MKFEPIDEMSLRHLFSSELGEKTLNLQYLGPTLNEAGQIDPSPDCLILDRKTNQIQRCEFKFDPSSAIDFKHNKKFDVAIVWRLSKIDKVKLSADLKKQNECKKIIVMSENAQFGGLMQYNHENLNSISDEQHSSIKRVATNSVYFTSVLISYIAALHPNSEFSGKSLQNLFIEQGSKELKGLSINKLSNIIVSHTQTKPQLILKKRKDYYQWNNELNPAQAAATLKEVILKNFNQQLPTKDFIEKFFE